jgi:hypothetical protein
MMNASLLEMPSSKVIWVCTKHHAELHAEIRQKEKEQKQ